MKLKTNYTTTGHMYKQPVNLQYIAVFPPPVSSNSSFIPPVFPVREKPNSPQEKKKYHLLCHMKL